MAHGLLNGKRGIITGALNDQSIAWKVAELAHAEGGRFVLTNAPVAMRMGEIKKLSDSTGAAVIPADATDHRPTGTTTWTRASGCAPSRRGRELGVSHRIGAPGPAHRAGRHHG